MANRGNRLRSYHFLHSVCNQSSCARSAPCHVFATQLLRPMQTVTPHRRTAEDHFEVVIRLRQSTNGQPSDPTLRLRAQALLKDILMSRLELEAEINAHESVHTRGFGDLGRALAASRALQLAFEGFRTAVPAARANVSVVLDSYAPDETVSTQPASQSSRRTCLIWQSRLKC